jgi:6-phosphogluconate dehydrogenase
MTTTKTPLQLGMIGLGRMGANMVRRLMRAGHTCVVYDVNADATAALVKEGAIGATSLADMASKLTPPRAAWVMVPLQYTESTVNGIADVFAAGDCVIDGGNSFFKDDLRRAAALAPRGLDYVDVGTSGGVWGLERGYCLMIGGAQKVVARLMPIFESLAPGVGSVERTPGRTGELAPAEQGLLHCGSVGSGHFVKMVHNGIEYGLMQAYAEGFDIMRHAADDTLPAEQRLTIDLQGVAEVWRRGSVVSSWLLDLTAQALIEDPTLSHYSGFVQDSGEGRWTINTAIEEAVPADVLSAALYARFRSRQEHTFAEKILSAMRHKFGGHTEPPQEGKGK